MIVAEQVFSDMLNAPARQIRARVELYNGSTLLHKICYSKDLLSFDIQRVGESNKFFGFGICHRLNVKVMDINRELNITTANTLDVAFGVGSDYIYPYPLFKVSEVHRDENTNELSITAYDALYEANNHTVSELDLPQSYTLEVFTNACARLLGFPLVLPQTGFNIEYPNGANFDGTETIRDALNDIAEATQTIYYLGCCWELTFKRLDRDGAAAFSITKDKYISLDSSDNRRLATITHATELGDNVSASITQTGSIQYVRDNAFWELRDDIGTLVDDAVAAIGGLTINQFECNWIGNFLLEIGDKIALTTKDGNVVYSYVLDDTIEYNGYLSEKTRFEYKEQEQETATNPSTLSDAIKQTYARVDKANKEIVLLASETADNAESIANIIVNTENITASVQEVKETTATINGDITDLTKKVEAAITSENVSLMIQNELSNGVETITTKTGFTFDADGLTIAKTDSEMETLITEDGMIINRDGEALLTANNEGVNAANLHATTYLIIGNNSRLEDYGNRTGCFWIGGSD